MSTAEASIFGPIIAASDVEEWCWALLRKWFGTYLAEVERQHGIAEGTLQRPRAFVTAPSFDKWPEDQLPALMLVSVGLAEEPLKTGNGKVRGRWQIGAACICSARTQAESHRMAGLYGAALYALFEQRPSLDGHARGVVWQDYTIDDDLEFDDLRSLSGALAAFTVEVDGIVTTGAGPLTPGEPLTPETEPWPAWPLAETVEVAVDAVELPDPLPPHEGG